MGGSPWRSRHGSPPAPRWPGHHLPQWRRPGTRPCADRLRRCEDAGPAAPPLTGLPVQPARCPPRPCAPRPPPSAPAWTGGTSRSRSRGGGWRWRAPPRPGSAEADSPRRTSRGGHARVPPGPPRRRWQWSPATAGSLCWLEHSRISRDALSATNGCGVALSPGRSPGSFPPPCGIAPEFFPPFREVISSADRRLDRLRRGAGTAARR